jgi:phage gp36-like protein
MPYATLQHLVERFSEHELIRISDRENTGAIDADVVAGKLADADAEIDGYLAGRYTLPLTTVPEALRRIACDVARYHLYDDRVTEAVQKRYDDAIKFLRMVAKGEVQLGVDTGGTAPVVSAGPQYYEGDQVFGRNNLRDFTG